MLPNKQMTGQSKIQSLNKIWKSGKCYSLPYAKICTMAIKKRTNWRQYEV